MEKITTRKKLSIIRFYLSGLPYDEIAARTGVSKGTVANVVTELKEGSFPEAADVGEQIEALRDLSLDLKRTNLTPGQCSTGLAILSRISECGLDPSDIDRWPMILRSVPDQEDAKEFVRLVYSIVEVLQRSGLSLEALDNKVRDLDKKAADLEPISEKVRDCQRQLAEVTQQREKLASSVALLEQRRKLLTPQVKDLERRDRSLSRRVADMEPRAQKAELTVSTLRREVDGLQDLGFSLKQLGEFQESLQMIAQQHEVQPSQLRRRLLDELGALDKGLTLEALVKTRQQELARTEKAITRSKSEMETTRAAVDSLKQEKSNLEASISEVRKTVSREIGRIIPLARETISSLGEELRCGNEEALAAVRRVRDEAVEAGTEVGRYQGMLQVSEWLNELTALVRGEESIEGTRVRIIVLAVVRALHNWLRHHDRYSLQFTALSFTTEQLINELERWEA